MPEQTGGGMPQQGAGGTPGAGGATGGAGGGTPQGGAQPGTFEAWLAGQDEAVKGLLTQHTAGLRSALESERTQRSELAKQLKEIKPEKGSEAEKSLQELQGKLEAAERRAQFAEDAHKPEIGCVNAKAAWALAMAEGLFDGRGNPNWAALKQMAPELFTTPGAARGNAGAGTGQAPQPAGGMNEFIRRAAGRT